MDNLHMMQDYADREGVALRPHTKTHKCPAIAKLQEELGAKGGGGKHRLQIPKRLPRLGPDPLRRLPRFRIDRKLPGDIKSPVPLHSRTVMAPIPGS